MSAENEVIVTPGDPGAPTDAAPEAELLDEQSPADGDADDGDATVEEPRRGVAKRIDELTREKYEARRERDHWRDLALRNNQGTGSPAPQQTQPAPQTVVKPTLEALNYDQEAFTAALVKFEAQKMVAEQRNADAQAKEQQESRTLQSTFASKAAEVAKMHADYHDVVTNPALPISQAMADTLMHLDNGPAVAYYLGTNPAEASKIHGMSPYAAAAALGRIEAKLANAKPVTTTRAPAPVKTLAGNAASGPTKSLEDMTPDEYSRFRNQQIYGGRKTGGIVRR